MIPQTGETVTLERDGQQRPGVVGEKQEDGSFVVFWLGEDGERLPGFWWSIYNAAGEPVMHSWRLVAPEEP